MRCTWVQFNPWVRKILLWRKWQPTQVLLPGKSHGQRSLAGYIPRDCKESDTTEQLNNNYKTHLSSLRPRCFMKTNLYSSKLGKFQIIPYTLHNIQGRFKILPHSSTLHVLSIILKGGGMCFNLINPDFPNKLILLGNFFNSTPTNISRYWGVKQAFTMYQGLF